MRRHLAGLLVSIVAFVPLHAHAGVVVPNGFTNEIVTAGLYEPNSMAFLPDWRILVTEQRTGKVRLIVGGIPSANDPIYLVPDLNAEGYEQGLQGIAVDPSWPERPYIYIYYDDSSGQCKVVRLTATGELDNPSGTYLSLGNPITLLDGIPDERITHNGGCVRFGQDGHLYVSTGDDDDPCAAADSSTLLGAILRLRVSGLEENITGRVTRDLITPYDNPLSTPDTNARLVWAYGMRNPWRFHIDSYTGRIYSTDVGLVTYEEINEILGGDNLGWPYREGPVVRPRGMCPEPGGSGSNTYKSATVSMLRDPEVLVSISSAGVYRPLVGASYNWPFEFSGDYFYGEYYTGDLYRLRNVKGVWMPGDSLPGQPSGGRFASGMRSAVDFQVGPDGSFYYLSQYDSTLIGPTGCIQRIRHPGPPPPLSVDPAFADHIYFTGTPNPFAGEAQLAFRLPRATPVRLDVYDLLGRRVRRLVDGPATAGENRVRWDGTDGSGRTLGSGVYLARLEFLGMSKSIRLVRLK